MTGELVQPSLPRLPLAYAFQNLLHIIVLDKYFSLFTLITVVILTQC